MRIDRVVVLIDGEHYPPVVRDAIESLAEDYGYEVAAAVFVGGLEKITGDVSALLGVPLYRSENPEASLALAIDERRPTAVVDLSDEPVLDYAKRFKLASIALIKGTSYIGADFRFDPPGLPDILAKPSIGVIGTGKRVGKTAVSGFACRTLAKSGFSPVAVAMGRGGPSKPELLLGAEIELSASGLLAFADKGKHAASDYFEDALTSRITTIGCRRCGGGMAGAPFISNVAAGAEMANALKEDLVIAEGSGATIPPVRVDAYLLAVGAAQPFDYIAGFFGTFRILLSDMVAITMAEEPFADVESVESLYSAIKAIKPEVKVAITVFRPKPLGEIGGKRVFVALTASSGAEPLIRKHLESLGAEVVGMSFSLSNRPRLKEELARAKGADILLTELKAAAVDVATRKALDMGLEVVYLDNEPVTIGGDGDLADLVVELSDQAVGRFSSR